MGVLSNDIINRLVPSVGMTPADMEKRFPPRPLSEGAEVTRFGPSPTGYVHIGSMLVALIAESVAHTSDGVFFLRIEDTDRSRVVEDAVTQLSRALEYFGISLDEGFAIGDYGPYRQSEREEVYDSYTIDLLAKGRAYPCFCTSEELAEITSKQRAKGIPNGYWGLWAKCRNLTEADVVKRLDAGDSSVIRFRAPEFNGKKIKYTDRVRGVLEIEDNRNDAVIRKSAGLPTYHMAHPIDDHLMRVTTVIRADEWLSSVPLHLQLFQALEFTPPDYGHIAPIMMMEGRSKRKLSKRKDPQANVDFYATAGYPTEGVLCYLRGLANSRLQDRPWREVLAAPILLEECSTSGQLLDLDKLEQICRDIISDMTYDELADRIQSWADSYDAPLGEHIRDDRDSLLRALSIEQSTPGHPRKDLAKWSDFAEKYGFLIPAAFELVTDASDERFAPLDADVAREMAQRVARDYSHDADGTGWFDQIRDAALALGFAPTVGEYKRNPDAFRGPLKVAANVVRVLLTGSTRSPDLHESARILGQDEVLRRLNSLA